MRIIAGLDGSEPSTRALGWCAANAKAPGAEVVAAFAIDLPIYPATGPGFARRPGVPPGVPFRGIVIDGSPAIISRALLYSCREAQGDQSL
jgi:hypothetical protein